MSYKAGGSHIAPSLSVVEILTALYFKIMRYDVANPHYEDRDRLIMSKGHASAALYAALAAAGYFDEKLLWTYCQPGSILGGHPDMHKIPGVEASTGALGHGFPYAMGIALAGKINKKSYRVYSILGDGECQEGTIWEAALFAAQNRLDNLTIVIDHNKLQGMDRIETIVGLEPFADKWESFGWQTATVNGHDIEGLINALSSSCSGRPKVIIANTTKGKGISFMENIPIWHYRLPNEEEMPVALKELGMTREELES